MQHKAVVIESDFLLDKEVADPDTEFSDGWWNTAEAEDIPVF